MKNILEKIIPEKSKLTGFEVSHLVPEIGERIMLLNAEEITTENESERLILLANSECNTAVGINTRAFYRSNLD